MSMQNQEALNALLNASVDTSAIKTKYTPVPEGTYEVLVVDYGFKDYAPKEAGALPPLMLEVKMEFKDPELAKELEQDDVIRYYKTWVNREDDGSLSTNNIGIGRFLEACGQSELGSVEFVTALESCKGESCMATVTHKLYQEKIQDKVSDLMSLAEYNE